MDKKDFFNQMAEGWDQRFYTPELKERLPQLGSLFHLQPSTRILDVGAGTGGIIPFLLEAVGPDGSIWAVDFAEEMVKVGHGCAWGSPAGNCPRDRKKLNLLG